MSLTPEQQKARSGKMTGSLVGILMRGDEAQLYDLWRQISGDPTYQEPDFSDNWAVQLGTVTEELNLKWFAKKHAPVSRQGEVVTHSNGWAACTLDGWANDLPIQCKHCIQYKKLPDILDWYAPQHHWEMYVTGTRRLYSSVIIGALEPEVTLIDYDDTYGDALLRRATDFMQCVWDLRPPVKLPEIPAPVRPEEWKTINMDGNNKWSDAAVDWLENHEASKKFEAAKVSIKELIESDVGVAYGYGIVAKRSKNGAITIKEGNRE